MLKSSKSSKNAKTRVNKKVSKRCSYCYQAVLFFPSRIRKGPQYCNRICLGNAMMTNQMQACAICNAPFYCSKSQLKYRARKTCSMECRSILHIQRAEERNRNNPPSIGVLNRRIRYSKKMDMWRKAVFERDNYTCQFCNVRGAYLEADHIKQFAYFPELRFDLNNGRTLCKDCHRKTPTYASKKALSC